MTEVLVAKIRLDEAEVYGDGKEEDRNEGR